MKHLFLLLPAVLLVGCMSAKTQKNVYRVTTAASVAECPVVIGDLPDWVLSAVVSDMSGREIASQIDRALNELAFVAPVNGTTDFQICYSSHPSTTSYPSRVHAQMWLKNPDKTLTAADTLRSEKDDMYRKLHHHGPAFESEYAAYRIYFDKKQTIDTYGKKEPRLELAETMWYPSDEQLAAGYGHDNLRVFGSVGVGALKGWDPQAQQMTHITDFKCREARILAKGPVRTVVEMEVDGWRYCGREIRMISRYILYAGHSDVHVENRFEGDVRDLVFTTGVMKMAGNEVVKCSNALVTRGEDYPENDTLKWEKERVGLAIAVPEEQIVSQIDDATSYLFQLKPDSRNHIDYVFDMWWRKSHWLDQIGLDECKRGMLGSVYSAAMPVVVSRIR